MEVFMKTTTPGTYFPTQNSKLIFGKRVYKTQSSCLSCSIKGWSLSCSIKGWSFHQQPLAANPKLFVEAKYRKSVIAEAKKNKKNDFHSFIAKPDEATGPFPEAVLLKEKKVQEDGRVAPEFEDAEEEKLFEFLNLQLESDLDLDRMRHYEVVYLIHEDHNEEVGKVNTKVEDFIKEKKGKIWRLNDWGLRRLAYKIKKAKSAHYMLMNFELEAKWINDFKTMLDKDERVIRHLVIKRDEAITEDCPPPPEFHTVRAGFDDDEDMDDDDDFDEDEFDDEEEELGDDVEEGIIVIDDVGEDRSSGSSEANIRGKDRAYA